MTEMLSDLLGRLAASELGELSWDKLPEPERTAYRSAAKRLFDLGLDCAKAVCAQRAENERVYSGGVEPTTHRIAEDIESFRNDGMLRPIGGAYSGAGQPIQNPLNNIKARLV